MSRGKHRKQVNHWRFWYMLGITTAGLGVIAACAVSSPTPAQGQEPLSAQSVEWKPMAVAGLEYACDPVLGVIVKHQWHQNGAGNADDYQNWTITVTPYGQLSFSQKQQMCGIIR